MNQWSNRTLWTEIQPSYISIWRIEFPQHWGRTQTPWTNQTRGRPQSDWTNNRGKTLSRNQNQNQNQTPSPSILYISKRRTLDWTETADQPYRKSILTTVTIGLFWSHFESHFLKNGLQNEQKNDHFWKIKPYESLYKNNHFSLNFSFHFLDLFQALPKPMIFTTVQRVTYGTKEKYQTSVYVSSQTSPKTLIQGYRVCSPWLLWWRGYHLTAVTSQGPPHDAHLLDNCLDWAASWLVGGEPCGSAKTFFWLYKRCQEWGMMKTCCKRDQLCKNNSTCFGCLWCLWLSLSCFGSIWLNLKIWKNAEKSKNI